ncbi:MAG: DUF4157 domain-containing protein, partial [Chloroflexota bacterium]
AQADPESSPGSDLAPGPARRATLGESRRAGLGPALQLVTQGPGSASIASFPATAVPSERPTPVDAVATATVSGPAHRAPDAATGAARPSAMLAGTIRSRRPSLPHRQRSAIDSASPGSQPPLTTGPVSGGPVRIDRSDAGAAQAASLRANAFTSGDTIVLPASHGPLDGAKGRSLLAHELVHIDQQRRLGDDLPAESSSAGQDLEREARSAEALMERSTKRPVMSLASPGAKPLPDTMASSSLTSASSGSGSHIREAVDTALTLVSQGTGDDGGSAEAATTAHPTLTQVDTPVVAPQRQDISATPAGATGSDDDPSDKEAELEELARQLYERIRYRIGRELLLDGERAGVLTDLR